jgi:tRNA pseudouridine32 synthase/23S rRNA pseudouridine746 synthase
MFYGQSCKCGSRSRLQAFIQPNPHHHESTIKTQSITIPIIYEDDNLLAICKPPHIPHHDDPRTNEMGILSLLRQQQADKVFSYPGRLYGVHRLDRVTSGVLVFAKDSTTANTLITKFRRKEIRKYYFALSGKKPKKKKQGWVRGQMIMGRRGSYKLVNDEKNSLDAGLQEAADGRRYDTIKNDRGGYAETRFYTAGLGNLDLALKCNHGDGHEEQTLLRDVPKTAILFEPHTGKTHQLRVAAKAVGLPLLGDARYGGGQILEHSQKITKDKDDSTSITLNRTYLHASAMHFELHEGCNVTICSNPPFGHLFKDESGFNDIFVTMMDKYCDCLPILDAVHASTDIL